MADPSSPTEWQTREGLLRDLWAQQAANEELAARFQLPSNTNLIVPVWAAETDSAESQEKSREPKRLGEAPPDDSRVFLRQSAVLLKPGTWEVEWGLRYALQENAFLSVLPDSSIVPEFTDARQILGTLSIRYGLAERWQPYLTLPAGASFYERSNSAGDDVDDVYGVGDILLGVNYLWRDGKNECADIITNFSVSAPTGPAAIGGLTTNQAALGSGFCTLSFNTTVVRTYDPVVLFASLGYSHQFASEFQNINVQPGELFNGSFGLGFAVNDDITLSTQLQTVVQLDFGILGKRVPDTGLESSLLRHSIVHRLCEKQFVEFFLIHGITDDAPRMSVGVLRTHRY
ncbi:transporter [Anatilimnocola floriformis]|uniref:transporter n=1 Tax=Anatilimnocola floriformis TaxID=2948575 RepID=UPI0020C1EC02|nr:transporter [Anatilimnocola floriformis]